LKTVAVKGAYATQTCPCERAYFIDTSLPSPTFRSLLIHQQVLTVISQINVGWDYENGHKWTRIPDLTDAPGRPPQAPASAPCTTNAPC